jgi:hypothetical protein
MPLLFCATLPAMTPRFIRKTMRWILDHMLWDTAGAAGVGFWPGLWATRKLLLALVGSGVLTWREWVEHHPPEIVIVELVHFLFLFAVIALLVYVGLRLRTRRSPTSQTPQ